MKFNIQAYKKCKQLEEWGIPHKEIQSGIVICDKIMIAKNRSRWKKLGSYEWYPYYGLSSLVEALYDDCLDDYAEEQQKSGRQFKSPPVYHPWRQEPAPKEKNT